MDSPLGEALYGSLLATRLMRTLVDAGVIDREFAIAQIDAVLLVLERGQAEQDEENRRAHVYARSRFELLLQELRRDQR